MLIERVRTVLHTCARFLSIHAELPTRPRAHSKRSETSDTINRPSCITQTELAQPRVALCVLPTERPSSCSGRRTAGRPARKPGLSGHVKPFIRNEDTFSLHADAGRRLAVCQQACGELRSTGLVPVTSPRHARMLAAHSINAANDLSRPLQEDCARFDSVCLVQCRSALEQAARLWQPEAHPQSTSSSMLLELK
jgi:hypothetical protein